MFKESDILPARGEVIIQSASDSACHGASPISGMPEASILTRTMGGTGHPFTRLKLISGLSVLSPLAAGAEAVTTTPGLAGAVATGFGLAGAGFAEACWTGADF